MAKPIEPLESRLARLTDREEVGCWTWRGTVDARGYGVIAYGAKRKLKAHRVAYEVHRGPISPGLVVCHRCDNPSCVNPDHLFLGTQGDNMRDAAAKGRQFVPAPARLHGEANPASRLTNVERQQIRGLALSHTQRELAERFGVGQATISRVLSAGASSPTRKDG